MPRVLAPRWMLLHALVLAVVVVMLVLGGWQLDRALSRTAPADVPAGTPPLVLTATLAPGQPLPEAAVGRLATARGRYDAARQVLSPGRDHAGQRGLWVVTPLRFVDGTGVPVVRGWVAAAGEPATRPPAGEVLVTGRLQASEEPRADSAAAEAAGQVNSIRTADLQALLGFPLFDGFLVATAERPAPVVAPARVPPGDLQRAPARRDVDPRNLAYGIQWWLFAAFTAWWWARLVRDATRGEVAGPAVAGPAAAAPPVPSPHREVVP